MSIQQEKFKAIADKIRSHLDTEDLIAPNDFAEKIDAVAESKYEKGHADGYFQRGGEENAVNDSRKAMLDEALRLTLVDIDESIDNAAVVVSATLAFLDSNDVVLENPNNTLSSLIKIQSNTSEAGIEQGIAEGIEQGKQSAYDEFWDSYQNNGARTDYSEAFEGVVWTQERFSSAKYPIRPTTATSMFKYSKVTDLTVVDLNFNKCNGFFAMCREATSLVSIGDVYTNLASNIGEIFYGCSKLVSIGVITVKASTAYGNSFYNCSKLTNITFAGTIGQSLDIRYSPLNRASIENIIECLSATATGKTLTLKKTAVNEAFGIDVDDETTYPEGSEYYTLRHSRDNWTISYV